MKLERYSYRYAEEILLHKNNKDAWQDIEDVVSSLPLFLHSGKGTKKATLDVDQQCMNAYFDRLFAVERNWEFHPRATRIKKSGLAADFRKKFSNITIQAEVQFGNASRFYADLFKFQAGYSQGVVDLGLIIIPFGSLARRMGENIVSYERVTKELPAAKSFLTLPVLVLGIQPSTKTKVIDIRKSGLPLTKEGRVQLTGKNTYRIANAVFEGRSITQVKANSPTGPIPRPSIPLSPEEQQDRGE